MSLVLPGNGALVIPGSSTLAARPALFASDTSIVDAGFVQRALGNFASGVPITGNRAFIADDIGKSFASLTTAASYSLPSSTGLPVGATITIITGTYFNLSTVDGKSISTNTGTGTSVQIRGSATLVWQGDVWRDIAFSGSSASGQGWVKVNNSGIIIQWGSVAAVGAGGGAAATFPITFPNAVLNVSATIKNSAGSSSAMAAGAGFEGNSGMTVFNNGNSLATAVSWMATGF